MTVVAARKPADHRAQKSPIQRVRAKQLRRRARQGTCRQYGHYQPFHGSTSIRRQGYAFIRRYATTEFRTPIILALGTLVWLPRPTPLTHVVAVGYAKLKPRAPPSGIPVRWSASPSQVAACSVESEMGRPELDRSRSEPAAG